MLSVNITENGHTIIRHSLDQRNKEVTVRRIMEESERRRARARQIRENAMRVRRAMAVGTPE